MKPAFVMLLALLSGCATRPAVTPLPIDWAARTAAVAGWTDWSARGRLALKSAAGSGQADFDWQQQGEASRIRVSGPFGAGAYEIGWDAQALSIKSRDGEFSERYAGADAAEQFLAARLGWAFPATSTRWWLLGLPDPASAATTEFAPDGRLASLVQNGWTVTYERYTDAAGVSMPGKVTAESARARLRLVVDRWAY